MGAASNPVRSARRKTELHDKLGSEHPVCFYCGYAEPVALLRVSRKVLDEHHLVGRNHDPNLTIIVCRNCHALRHEGLFDAGVELEVIADPVKRVAMMLRAEAVHLEAWAHSKREQANLLDGEDRDS
jgi:hypothetical protein